MLLTPHALSAVWFDLEFQKFIGFESMGFNSSASFKSVVQNFGTTNRYCKSKSILIANQLFTLVPNDLYAEKDRLDFLKFNQEFNASDFNYETSDLEGVGAKCVFAIHHDIYDELIQAFKSLKIQAVAKPFIENSRALSKAGAKAFIEIHDGRFDVAFFKDQELMLYNAFEFKDANDLMYYLLFVMEQLDFNREEDHLYLSGELSEEGEIYKLIYRYIRNVNWLTRPSQFSESDLLSEIPKHYHFSLFNQILCE